MRTLFRRVGAPVPVLELVDCETSLPPTACAGSGCFDGTGGGAEGSGGVTNVCTGVGVESSSSSCSRVVSYDEIDDASSPSSPPFRMGCGSWVSDIGGGRRGDRAGITGGESGASAESCGDGDRLELRIAERSGFKSGEG